MDKNKPNGIRFDAVFLSELLFKLPNVPPDKFQYNLNFNSNYSIDTEKQKLIYCLQVKLFEGFEISITGIFSTIKGEENLDLTAFSESNAPALIMPFLRQIVHDITSKSPLPPLLLPPINIFALINKKESTNPAPIAQQNN